MKKDTFAVLIAIRYSNSQLELKNIIVDLYIMYKYCINMDMKIKIVTDIESDNVNDLRKSLLNDKMINADEIINFIKRTKNITYKLENTNFKDIYGKNILLEIIPENTAKLFIYFSGHGSNGNFIFGNIEYSMSRFRKEIESRTTNNSETIIILDCCDSSHFPLRYEITNNKFIIKNNSLTSRRNIICICQRDNTVTITDGGSLFTRTIVEILTTKKPSSWEYLIVCINQSLGNSNQTRVFGSIFGISDIYPWIYKRKYTIGISDITYLISDM